MEPTYNYVLPQFPPSKPLTAADHQEVVTITGFLAKNKRNTTLFVISIVAVMIMTLIQTGCLFEVTSSQLDGNTEKRAGYLGIGLVGFAIGAVALVSGGLLYYNYRSLTTVVVKQQKVENLSSTPYTQEYDYNQYYPATTHQ
jgi:hypothetical protein